MVDKVDVVIVGAGAAASVYAAVLAQAGKQVRVLETGPARRLEDLYSSQISARRLKWAQPEVLEAGKDSVWFNFNAGRGYGGAAVHHFGVWPRYHPEDFKEQSLFGRGLDWPMEYDDLRPYYDRVQAEVGLSGDAEAEIWRPPGDPYPLPPVPVWPHGEVMAKGFASMDMAVAPVPLAVLTQPYKGRAACIYDGWCEAGCPTGALANPLVVYFPQAIAAGAVLQSESHVTRVLTDNKGERANGVEYVNATGERQTLLADAVVLAAFTIENPRILLNSASPSHPDGLANSSGLVGRNLMTHPSVNIFGLFDENMQNHMGVNGGQLINQDRFDKVRENGPYGSRQWIIGSALKPNDLLGIAMSRADLFGQDLQQFMERAVRGLGTIVAISQDQPNPENRIELASEKDAHGYPLARVHYQASSDGLALWQASVDEGQALLGAAGADEVWHSPRGGQHIMGGTIMGETPGTSVTNAVSQTHDVPNLFIGGPGVFPTSSAVNSTYHLHALALKSAEHLRDNWASLVG